MAISARSAIMLRVTLPNPWRLASCIAVLRMDVFMRSVLMMVLLEMWIVTDNQSYLTLPSNYPRVAQIRYCSDCTTTREIYPLHDHGPQLAFGGRFDYNIHIRLVSVGWVSVCLAAYVLRVGSMPAVFPVSGHSD